MCKKEIMLLHLFLERKQLLRTHLNPVQDIDKIPAKTCLKKNQTQRLT
jgi:hypothetical protein